ncbi:MAG: DUF167 domain-containing protein [Candidatus Omnitrophica bacterium]|nr:DUF167 domain-containing protein [Candidatus Omnitrophota bacterium]
MKLTVRVIPRSSQEKIVEEKNSWKVYVHPAAEGGKANGRILELISEKLDVPKSKLKIIKGTASRIKLIEVSDA